MKKNLLVVTALFIGLTANAQFTQSNSPTDGDGLTLYVIDSLAPNFDNETGASASWDYSSYSGYNNETRNVTALDASSTPNASSFIDATETIDMEGFLKSYTSSTENELTGYGFVFNEPNIGEVVAKFDTDQAILYNYPMDENSSAITDVYSGVLDFDFGGPQSSDLEGNLVAKVDGKGTLKLAESTYNDVLRYKIVDTIYTTISILGDVRMVRVQYEYYDHNESTLPIFVHSTINFKTLSGQELSNSTLVMSLEDPSTYVGLVQNELANTSVYPIPATNQLNIELPVGIESANVIISDVQGREVYSSKLNATKKVIDVSTLNKGMYIVNISNNTSSIAKNILIK